MKLYNLYIIFVNIIKNYVKIIFIIIYLLYNLLITELQNGMLENIQNQYLFTTTINLQDYSFVIVLVCEFFLLNVFRVFKHHNTDEFNIFFC